MRKFLLGVLCVFAISGCKAGDAQDLRSSPRDVWVLESIRENRMETGVVNRPELKMDVSEMRLSGSDGCNRIMGKMIELDERHLKFGPIASTLMACPDMKTPYDFTKALDEVRGYKREGPKLSLLDAGGQEVLEFRKVD